MITGPIIPVWYNGYVLGQELRGHMLFFCPSALRPTSGIGLHLALYDMFI